MPTYEYRCRECGHQMEAVQSFTDAPLTECPSCGGALRKKFGAPGISFKGSGFYKTDSRPSSSSGNGGSSPSPTAETSSTSSSEGSSPSGGSSPKAPATAGSSSSSGAAQPASS